MNKPYTVIGIYAHNAQIFSEFVLAENRMSSFTVCAGNEEYIDAEFVCSIDGHVKEGETIDFAGTALVDTDTVLEQSDVFS